MKVVIDNKIPFIKGALEQYCDVVYREGNSVKKSDLLDADALIVRTRTKCNAGLLDGTKVRFIATATIGYDHIDTEYCKAHRIAWTNAAGCNASSVQQYIAAALLQLAKKLGYQLSKKTIGIVGVGNVGSKVEIFCRAIGMHVLLNDPPRARREGAAGFVSLEEIAERADILTFHVPLNRAGEDATYHLVDKRLLSRVRKDQIFINSSRGEVVETASLKSILGEKKLAGCILDVWENEPGIDAELLGLADIGTPHIAGYSADGKANGTSMSVQALSRFFHLGVDAWRPSAVPLPERTVIDINCTDLDEQEILRSIIHSTYDILADDRRLRTSPQTFEKQRGEYPLRREFPSYRVRLSGASGAFLQMIKTLGFNIQDSQSL
jgi:erythronate-4-phosphate dehydrogenase